MHSYEKKSGSLRSDRQMVELREALDTYGLCDVGFVGREPSQEFFPLRRLIQGDPLSPYLFLFCAEGFSTLLHVAMKDKLMRGAVIGRERYPINHLFFADDSILFGDASEEGANTMRNIITKYEQASGQRCFALPKLLCRKLEGLLNRFWCGFPSILVLIRTILPHMAEIILLTSFVKWMKAKDRFLSFLYGLFGIKETSWFVKVSYLYIPRKGNGAAHTLALEGRRKHIAGFWPQEPPVSVRKIIEKEWDDWV
ncbi:hypothetical protein J1N35_045281 [Gossypium stocksii]|uniref:Reverse transcriptase n=1 Tax=Gossypium stocksii TaxID=47602 RepID=A0A9D3UAS8_9ROSI|nr:hypothetical protein J1N35_045281 [Gossypium stocksii]